jgi:hypothetical protein
MRNAVLLDGVAERVSDVLLPDDIGEPLRAIFSGDYLIGHGWEFTIYDLRFTSQM